VVHDQLRWHAYHRHAVRSGDLNSKDVFLSAVPTPFGFGIWTAHVTPMLLGCPLVVVPKFSAETLLEMIGVHRVSVVAAVSTQFIMMLNSPAMATADLSSLRILYTGGEAVPYNRASEFEDRTGATVLQFYGSNETGAFSYTTLQDSRERRLTTAGRIMPEMQLRLYEGSKDVTASGRGQPAGKGDVLSKGYYRNDEANRKLFTPDGWMLMEDIVTIDAEGYLTVVGRVGDFIIRGGKNVSAAAVEEAVTSHPAVGVAAAVAAPDPVFGERVMLFVETKDGQSISLPEVVRHLEAAQASKEIYPEYLVVLPELPRAPGGKVAKGVLREEAKKRAASMQPGSEAHG
jgi:acyl-CoA synthetase